MHLEAVRRRHIWNNLPLHFKGLMLLMVPVPALLLALVVLSGTLKRERQAIASVESLTTARQRLQDISSVLLVPGAPAQDYNTLARMTKDLSVISSDRDRWDELEAVIQQKLGSLRALSAAATPDRSLLDTDRQATESLQSNVSALALEYDQLLVGELNRVKAARAELFAECFKGVFIFLLGELLAALAFLGAVAGQVSALKTNSRRLAEGLPLEPLFTDNWELNQIGHDLLRASAELARRERALESGSSQAPGSGPAEHLDREQQESLAAQLRERNQKLAESLTTCREALASKGHFLTRLSRDLRVPLSSILGFAELLHDAKLGPLSDEQRGCLGDILAGSRRLLQLADSVVGAAQAGPSPAAASCEPVDLEGLLEEVKRSLLPAARRKGVRLEVEVDPSLRQVQAVRERLSDLVLRHISKAVQFTPHDASLEVRLRPDDGDTVRLEAHITGLGLPAQDVVRLYPEFRLGPAPAGMEREAGVRGECKMFFAILPGIAQNTEPAVRVRNGRARGTTGTASVLVH